VTYDDSSSVVSPFIKNIHVHYLQLGISQSIPRGSTSQPAAGHMKYPVRMISNVLSS